MNKATVKNGLKIALVAGGIFALVPAVYGQGIGLQTLDRMTAGTPQQIDRGEQVYQDQCAECHGEAGQGPTAMGEQLGALDFSDPDAEFERSALESIYSVIVHGYEYEHDEQVREHPVFENLAYQDQWAVSHYVHNLIDDPQPAPDDVVARIREEAEEGICDPEIREGITEFLEPESEEQLQLGADEYATRCATCHGDEGRGDGPGAGTVPPARDFQDPVDEWTTGTSPLAIFNTLDQGIEGTAMASFGHLEDEVLWAMTHHVIEEYIPEGEREEVSDEEVEEVCRSLSAPPQPEPIPVNRAMEFVVGDADEERLVRLRGYGDPMVHTESDPLQGQELFEQSCASCHGADGQSTEPIGPYGKFPPYLHIEPSQMVPASAGGTYEDLARRTIEGPHAALPDRPSVATFSDQQWMDLQAFITQFEGEGRERIQIIDSLEDEEDVDDEQAEEEELEEDEELGEDEGEEADDDAEETEDTEEEQ